LGDFLYGKEEECIKRHALHCEQLHFYHPVSNKPLFFSCPIPEDMERMIRASNAGKEK
jgi:23S rRNA pseudouridine1911/1915/1917 synthase